MNNNDDSSPFLIIVMGVSGTGKTSLAKALAKDYGVTFMEADDYHSELAIQHMASGKPLDDVMREPWISKMIGALRKSYSNNCSCVLSYSGLKAAHRQRFRELPHAPRIVFVMLDGDKNLIAERIKKRNNHFMPEQLLDSQFDALERPVNEPDVVIIPAHHSLVDVIPISKKQLAAYLV